MTGFSATVIRPLVLLVLISLATGTPVRTARAEDRSAIPMDSSIRTGTLPNGMRYYLRTNGRPEKRVSLRLAVNIGATVEDDDQRGLAHFMEHMCFNGSKHFAPGELIKYLESIGARFGADANAYTSFDRTVYELEIPTDRDSLVLRGLEAMSDYAGRASLLDAEIDRERGVVLEEWRMGQGAANRMRRKILPVLYHDSRYAERLPIGLPEIIEKAPYQRVKDFYRDWYRPERMAIVAVGDIDLVTMEQRIRAAFADLVRTDPMRTHPVFEVPPHRETLVVVATDPEARGSSVSLTFKHPRGGNATVTEWRDGLVESLYAQMLSQRLDEVARTPDAPFLSSFAYSSGLGRTVDTFVLQATTVDGGIVKGVAALAREMNRVRRHGFLEAELDRARAETLSRAERAWHERDKSESSGLAEEIVENFLEAEPVPGVAWEYETMRRLLPGITLEEIVALTPRLLHDENRVLQAQSPEKPGLTPPTEAELRGALDLAMAESVAPWEDIGAGLELMATPPKPGTITARREIPEIGVTVWTLSNGVEFWLKPTDFKNDEILFRATARGGASVADPADYQEAVSISGILGEMGIGGFTPVQLEKLLAGKLVGGSPFVGSYTHGLAGSSTPKDLETALQLLYLTVTAPTERPEGFEVWRRRLASGVANRLQNPETVFGDTVRRINTKNFYMSRPLTPGAVDSLSLEPALAFYRRSYANAADFRFYMVGAFTLEAVEPLVCRYVASLPSRGKPGSAFVDRGLSFPTGVQTAEVRRGVEPKSQTNLTFFADPGGDEFEMHRLRVATGILRIKLREILREELGGTYSVSASATNSRPLPGYGTVSISFGSAPGNVEAMVGRVLREIERLRAEGPTDEDVRNQQELERRELETAEKQNNYWLSSLDTAELLGLDPRRIAKRRERIDLLTRENLHATFQKYLPLDRYTRVSLFPEAGGGGAAGATPGGH